MPSMQALKAFEAAARNLSFLQASEELNVTPGAVSRQIQGLEALLNARLFLRHHKRIELTAAGRSYLDDIRTPLAHIGAATARLRDAEGTGALSICAYPTFAIRWFIPRWGRFYDRHPDIDIRLTTSLQPVDFSHDDYDMAIQVLPEDEEHTGFRTHKIVDVVSVPACAPEVAARLNRPEDLAKVTLLHDEPRPQDWARWLRFAGVTGIEADKGLQFESLNLTIQAAIDGLGVAMAIEALIGDDLVAGRLVLPFATRRRSGHAMQLIYPEAKAGNANLHAFRDWLVTEAALADPLTGC